MIFCQLKLSDLRPQLLTLQCLSKHLIMHYLSKHTIMRYLS